MEYLIFVFNCSFLVKVDLYKDLYKGDNISFFFEIYVEDELF